MNAPGRPSIPRRRIPREVRELVARLEETGHRSVLVGGCVRDLLRGLPVHDFDVATAAPPECVLGCFPNAIPIGLRFGTVMVPTPIGPVDVTTFRAGTHVEDDLARRDFTVNAIAFDLASEELIDPQNGCDDLLSRRLRAVVDANARFDEDPLRALRAARLVATLGLEPDPTIEPAMKGAVKGVAALPGERLRAEIDRLLPGERAGEAIRLLRRAGIEQVLVPGAHESAPERIDALPARRNERLAAWLIGTRVLSVTARLRYPRRLGERLQRLLARHPVHTGIDPASGTEVRRLMRHAGDEGLELLFELAQVDLTATPGRPESEREAARLRLDRLREAVVRARRSRTLALHRGDLALDGADVMRLLGIAAGPRIGRALRHLTECVLEHPERNTADELARELREWADRSPPR